MCLFFIYMCMVFFFRHGYLLHNVVYNTVVCINTIIYFSMGGLGGWGAGEGEMKKGKRTTSLAAEPGEVTHWFTWRKFSKSFPWMGEKLVPCEQIKERNL